MTGLLVADDHALFRRGLTVALETQNFGEIRAVDDGSEVLKIVDEVDPEAIILDVRMKEMGGVETLSRLRQRGDNRPVVILAAEIEDSVLSSLLAMGANAILLKNGTEFRLFDAIRAVIEGARVFDPEILERIIKVNVSHWYDRLNKREIEIAHAVSEGLSNKEISEKLGVSLATVKIYVHGIFSKTGVNDRHELALKVRSQPLQAVKNDR